MRYLLGVHVKLKVLVFRASMQPTEAQLRQLYKLIQDNWQRSGLLYDFGADLDSVYPGCYVAVFGTPVNHSDWTLTQAYYIYADGTFLSE
jgi:hypothetical protein